MTPWVGRISGKYPVAYSLLWPTSMTNGRLFIALITTFVMFGCHASTPRQEVEDHELCSDRACVDICSDGQSSCRAYCNTVATNVNASCAECLMDARVGISDSSMSCISDPVLSGGVTDCSVACGGSTEPPVVIEQDARCDALCGPLVDGCDPGNHAACLTSCHERIADSPTNMCATCLVATAAVDVVCPPYDPANGPPPEAVCCVEANETLFFEGTCADFC